MEKIKARFNKKPMPRICSYAETVRYINGLPLSPKQYPLVIPGWDNSPRSGVNGVVLHGTTPELFKDMLMTAIKRIERVPDPENRIVFVKAWNEWAEGNYLEPDLQHGHAYLQVVKECVMTNSRAGENK
jgi:lipopolysaccharide biosynthesis protein